MAEPPHALQRYAATTVASAMLADLAEDAARLRRIARDWFEDLDEFDLRVVVEHVGTHLGQIAAHLDVNRDNRARRDLQADPSCLPGTIRSGLTQGEAQHG